MTHPYSTWKMVCSEDSSHDKFKTCVTELVEWEVDCYGDFLQAGESIDTIDHPDPDNRWTCAVCGADAERRDVET
jgi:hypothetical protein